jgi:hypothetical protein
MREPIDSEQLEADSDFKRGQCLDWAKATDEAMLKGVRDWVWEAVLPTRNQENGLYDTREDLDIARDIVGFLPAFRESPKYSRNRALDSLGLLHRFVLRRYAFTEAGAIRKEMKKLETGPWRLWFNHSFLLWRLLVGVLAGFLLLASSGSVVDALYRACKDHPVLSGWLMVAEILVVLTLAFHEVLRRNGRSQLCLLICRIGQFVLRGIVYAAAGGAVQYYLGLELKFDVSLPFVVLSSLAALVLGFVFQIIWQDRSIGDPQ